MKNKNVKKQNVSFGKVWSFFFAICALLAAVILYFMFLPALNLQSLGFWFYGLVVLGLLLISQISFRDTLKNKKNKFLAIAMLVLAVCFFLAVFIGTPAMGGMNAYRSRISIPESSSFEEIDEFDQTQVQIIDKDVSTSLADRVFGEMGAEVVSQYEISSNYASVVVNDTMYRLTPVEYSGFVKWLSTNRDGTPGFISVNVTTGDTEFHNVEEGLKYMPYAKLGKNLNVHLRFQYPSYIFGNSKFEVDDSWHPYWVTQVLTYSFVGKAEDVKGVVVTDPCSGESTYYDVADVPSWVDNVYDASLICDQYNSYGRYINGFFNLSQKGETATTDDYAYLQKNGHLWMYTGVTSVSSDESNVGFIYVDLQNKDVIYIVSAGAEEYSARASAEGAVQEKGYSSVFPTMVNVEGEPTYFMGLKDNAGLIKAYAFVSYKNYQKVGVGTTVNEALKAYTGKTVIVADETEEKEIIIKDVQNAVLDGYTVYFIQSMDNEIYTCSIEISNQLPFVKTGETYKISFSNEEIVSISKVEVIEEITEETVEDSAKEEN